MESLGKKKPRPRCSFTPQFKAEIVELCQRGDRTVDQIAKDFDLTETAVRDWVKQAEVDAGVARLRMSTSSRRRRFSRRSAASSSRSLLVRPARVGCSRLAARA